MAKNDKGINQPTQNQTARLFNELDLSVMQEKQVGMLVKLPNTIKLGDDDVVNIQVDAKQRKVMDNTRVVIGALNPLFSCTCHASLKLEIF